MEFAPQQLNEVIAMLAYQSMRAQEQAAHHITVANQLAQQLEAEKAEHEKTKQALEVARLDVEGLRRNMDKERQWRREAEAAEFSERSNPLGSPTPEEYREYRDKANAKP